ncbi:DoxX family protein [Aureimonas leprariae]|uniref:DoxX family protein n=1 Tax=Plantimonas leprariae TaxID=2615207 RepID=A0A7V7TUA6_9HYPH|nr:DoxX family protein [Aureimonas leprariae]KAB0675821.1 DoxX family protein [Aureimonas leprariae]
MNNNAILLIARVLLSIIFIVAGFGKLTGAEGFAGMLGGMGFPSPLALAYLTGLCELVGGLCVLLGFQVRIVGPLMALFCLFTGYIAHLGDATALMKNIALAGGYLTLAVTGAGAFSFEGRKRVSAYA